MRRRNDERTARVINRKRAKQINSTGSDVWAQEWRDMPDGRVLAWTDCGCHICRPSPCELEPRVCDSIERAVARETVEELQALASENKIKI